MKKESISTILKADKLKELINIFKDLTQIKEHIRMKVQNGIMLFYSIDDQNGQVLAFKYYKKQVLDFFDHDLEDLDFVILNVKKLTKQLSLYEAYGTPLSFNFETEDATDLNSSTRMVSTLEIKNGKLKTFLIGGEPGLIRNLGISTIFEKVDIRFRRFGFEISIIDFNQILQLISLVNDPSHETVQIILDGTDIIFREKGWELNVGTSNMKEQFLFKKKYLNNFDPKEIVLLDMFDNFLVLRGTDNDLMISLEHEN